MPDLSSPGWWRDEWGEWHGPAQDLGNSGPRESRGRQLPPHLRVVPDPVEEPATTTAVRPAAPPLEAPEAVPGAPAWPGPVPQGKRASDGMWVGNVWQERPPPPTVPIDPVTGIRLYLKWARDVLERKPPR